MVTLALWVAACLVLAWVLKRRPVWLVAIAFLLWMALPAVAGYRLNGVGVRSPIGFHPATWLVIVAFVVQMLWNPLPLLRTVSRHPYLGLVVGLFVFGAGITSVLSDTGGARLLADQIVAPLLLALLVVTHADRAGQLLLRNVVLVAAAAQSVLSLVQTALGSIIFFADDFATNTWFNPARFDRWMGTTDSPLILSLLLCAAAALTLGLRSNAARFSLLVLFSASTLVTQSRLGGFVMLAVLVLAVFRTRTSVWTRLLTAGGLVLAVIWLDSSGLAGGLLSRLQNDTGSSQARERAARFFLGEWSDVFLSGHGLTASYQVARDAGLQTSIESSVLMYAIDVGLILAALYFGAQAVILLRYGLRGWLEGVFLSGVILLVLQNGSSALAFANLTGTLTWVVLGLVMAGYSTRRREQAQRSGAPAATSLATSVSS
ncbi:MAG: hypothetical protein CVT65_14935 [Actinobacteria bacterium HGW-Actinobacteria-5]|jgi:hypothetical protein|nr:MAG: hypothetical protein CVT65_14935 [Actinobacteria bacterium HGW-Actinobacteria-5]